MNETAFDRFWELLGWVLALNSEAFEQINTLPYGSTVALVVVLAASLSQVVAQSVILFVNRVTPVRFVFTLLIGTVLFAFGYLFLVLSTWLISFAPFTVEAPFSVVARTLGFSYAPLIFSVFGAMPYLGEPILSVLSLWQLLAMVVGFAAASDTTVWQAFGTVALGWLTLWLMQRTIGQPIAQFGYWVACQVAGVELVTKRERLPAILQKRLRSFATNLTAVNTKTDAVTSSSMQEEITSVRARSQYPTSNNSPSNAALAAQTDAIDRDRRFQFSKIVRQLPSILVLSGVTCAAIVLLSPIRYWWFAWYGNLGGIFKLAFDLVWIGIIAFVAAALLAPLEALGWWAGWYGDRVNTTPTAIKSQHISQHKRYVVYLDGIGQSTFDYLPDIQEFLNSLAPVLPEDMMLIKGIMPYSVRNTPLTGSNRPLAFFWRLADSFRLKNPASLFGYLVNIRNVLVVAVSADRRYGPIYNLGIAKVIYQALFRHGYQPDSGVPITLIGFSGGGQMAAGAAPFLRQALTAPIEVISLGGVISGNVNVLKLEHLYHLVGDKDLVERMGLIFPKRWAIFFLSYWNRAKRMGKVNRISLGSVGHQLPGGLMDPERFLPDGRSYLQQTIDWVIGILLDMAELEDRATPRKLSNYERYRQAAFNLPQFYPIHQSVSQEYYRPIAPWMGRLILPTKDKRQVIQGVLFEVHHAPADFQHLVGQVVVLRLSDEPQMRSYVKAVTKDVYFSAQAEYSTQQGNIHPTRINHWRLVDPLESLAGSHPNDDVMVMLQETVAVQSSSDSLHQALQQNQSSQDESIPTYILCISRDPVQITGRYYGLVKFLQPVKSGSDLFRVVHFNRISKQFNGAEEIVRMPSVVANRNNTYPSTHKDIEKSPLNETGWYIYGAPDESGVFVIQALAPRVLFQVEPERRIEGRLVKKYLKKECWSNLTAQKGKISTSLLSFEAAQTRSATAWREGKRALLIHVYGGIGGKKTEPKAKSPVYFGHFAYGIAKVVREPLTDELRFEIVYHQIYTHNTDGLIAGSLHWSRYMGDRSFGWMGLRPVCDTLVELDGFTGDYETQDGQKRSPLDQVIYQLEIMAARYRIGDGTGGTFVGPANNCTQDANQALYAALRQIAQAIRSHPNVEEWKKQNPEQLHRLEQLEQLSLDLKRLLLPWGTARADWKNQAEVLGSTLEDNPVQNLVRSLLSWRTILPRLTSDEVTQAFLRQGGSAWVLRTNQLGGVDPDIEPVAPITL
ncbi:CAAX protease [Gloeocapsopsis crepidinum LEGE 06123]|uniref:CAAX protease n=1 Tax=Gloeocapsopsis crepidinum LEGE 06123 TaxID=588587 RepID=A0ABR9UXD3_9CHRO|nr:CAAX protease [Gloeocapsopsis crepidinum]MBE9192975.1 CAAX protease [Gloeocapsopsis crepidinum LEGE 06123]